MMLKKSKSLELEKTSPVTGVYNATFQKITTSVKDNSQNMEGLDTKLNQAQNKISTLEVELANDLRKFSLHRSSSDAPRRSFSPGESRLSPGSYSMRRPRSYSNLSADDRDSPDMSIPRSESSPSVNEDLNSGFKSRSTPEIAIRQADVDVTEYTTKTTEDDLSLNLSDGKQSKGSSQTLNSPADSQLSELDPFLSKTVSSSSENLHSSEQIVENLKSKTDQEFSAEAMSFFVEEFSSEDSQAREIVSVQEIVTSTATTVTREMTSLPSPSMQLGSNGEEELIYF